MTAVPFPLGPCVLLLVITAAACDLRTRRIPNWLVATALVAALPAQWMLHGAVDGLAIWSAGWLFGGLIFLPGYMVRALGAGDVKLMAAVGAWLGITGAIETSMIACMVGGVWAVTVMLLKRRMKDGLSNTYSMLVSVTGGWRQAVQQGEVMRAVSVGRLPFGVAIAIGALGTIVLSVR
ncbi:A24 family peptidase [Paraburkholderia rhizosphaerae]|uniref:Prepilin peptidase CpaA n=1 Tax=Paraburkholderia rhizosphaerae TaxID=480658 RepID=A0A4R8LV32_9BURK|nr:prepilin peptidase [Paraburkholderia rhizosphaerae]TDY51663.1 prepilin peptidase CpaA [Paraburkholderia rhizosphaerae]